MSKLAQVFPKFGDQTPFAEPAWYQGIPSPYYRQGHVEFRAKVRKFVEEQVRPHVDEWVDQGTYPLELHRMAYRAGVGGMAMRYGPDLGGYAPADVDPFYELIAVDEFSRGGFAGVLGQDAIDSMALPPIINAGPAEMIERVVKPVVRGDKHICLAISEPSAGSDVSAIQTTARRDGDHYVINGEKKWITGGLFGDFFTVAVRTGGDGPMGISLLLVERERPGINIRRMKTQFDSCHNTTFITFEDVRVPVENLIGEENQGLMLLFYNFNHERFVIAAGACRGARECYADAFKYALKRKTFGKTLMDHQIIRFKLAEMARRIEALHASLEMVAFAIANGASEASLGGMCALLKVNSSSALEFCAREASQIYGGSAIVREGQGKMVERAYRGVRAAAIPGGSEEILLDFAIRQAAAKARRLQAKL